MTTVTAAIKDKGKRQEKERKSLGKNWKGKGKNEEISMKKRGFE